MSNAKGFVANRASSIPPVGDIVSEKEVCKDLDIDIDALPHCYLVKVPESLQKVWGLDKKDYDTSLESRLKRGAISKIPDDGNKVVLSNGQVIGEVIMQKNKSGEEELSAIAVSTRSDKPSERAYYKFIPGDNKFRVPQLIASISNDQVDMEVSGIIKAKGDLRIDEKYAKLIQDKIAQQTRKLMEKDRVVGSMDVDDERALQQQKAIEMSKVSVSLDNGKKRQRDDDETTFASRKSRKGASNAKSEAGDLGYDPAQDDFIFQKLLKAFSSVDQYGEKREHILISDLATLTGIAQDALRPYLKKYCDCPQSGEYAHKYNLKPQYVLR